MVKASASDVSELLVALPMYDLPQLQKHNDVFWTAVAQRLIEAGLSNVPARLHRSDSPLLDLWRAPGLLLAQTCGYPLMKVLQENVQLVATPKYLAEGCQGAYHRSAIVVRRDDEAKALMDLRGRRCAVNEMSSNSGMNLLRGKIAPLSNGVSFFSSVLTTGSHLTSLRAVADNIADVAAIDCVTLAHLKRYFPDLVSAVRVIEWTDESPGLPFITAEGTDESTIAAIRTALFSTLLDENLTETRQNLLLDGFEILPLQAYQKIDAIEQQSIAFNYSQLK
jgi:ABC-type phosphate/phosphonate transport system substrate-binding protein